MKVSSSDIDWNKPPPGATGQAAPIGAIVSWPTATAPAGWLICNGAAISQATYAALYAVIGNTYDGSRLSDENASFEGNTVGTWTHDAYASLAADATQGFHGTHSLRATAVANNFYWWNVITALVNAGWQYTASARLKGVVGRSYCLCLSGNVSGNTYSTPVVTDGTWQIFTVTKTFNAGDTTMQVVVTTATATAGDVAYLDAVQLKVGPGNDFKLPNMVATPPIFLSTLNYIIRYA